MSNLFQGKLRKIEVTGGSKLAAYAETKNYDINDNTALEASETIKGVFELHASFT